MGAAAVEGSPAVAHAVFENFEQPYFVSVWSGYVDAMRWTIDEIRTFLDVMDTGTVSKAADRANLSKSVISKRISDLELALGASLFQRHAGRITPTRTAQELALRLRPTLVEMTQALESAAWGMAGLRGSLSISAPMSFGTLHLGQVLAEFAKLHPELELIVDYDDRVVDLVRGRVDLALRIGQLPDSGLMVRHLCEDPRALCASPAYLSRRGEPKTLEELVQHPAIGYLNVHAAQVWQFLDEQGEAVSVPMQGRITANNGEAMRDMAVAGLGIALLPRFIAHDALKAGQLVRIAERLTPTPLPISAVWPPAKPMPMKLRAIIDHLAAAFSDRPPWMR